MNTDTYKNKLQEEKNLLESELTRLGHFDKKSEDWEAIPSEQIFPEADENDRSDRAEDFEERTAVLNTLEIRLNDIKTALGKIDAGTYGTCEKCGNQIEADRLEANGAARTCKACME